MPCSFEIDDLSVDDHLVFSGVGWDVVHIFNFVAVGAKRIDDEVDVYHVHLEGDGRGGGCLLLFK